MGKLALLSWIIACIFLFGLAVFWGPWTVALVAVALGVGIAIGTTLTRRELAKVESDNSDG